MYVADRRPIFALDEMGVERHMCRTHGYAPKGKKCHGIHDYKTKNRVNVIGTIDWYSKRFVSVWLLEGSTVDSDVFHAYSTKDLIPKLPNNSVIIMDNTTFHKR